MKHFYITLYFLFLSGTREAETGYETELLRKQYVCRKCMWYMVFAWV